MKTAQSYARFQATIYNVSLSQPAVSVDVDANVVV